MSVLTRVFDNNAAWPAQMVERDARSFERLQRQQARAYLWIGCSESRVPANDIVGLAPGDVRAPECRQCRGEYGYVEYYQAVTQMSARASA
jgi:hypothetical protein